MGFYETFKMTFYNQKIKQITDEKQITIGVFVASLVLAKQE